MTGMGQYARRGWEALGNHFHRGRLFKVLGVFVAIAAAIWWFWIREPQFPVGIEVALTVDGRPVTLRQEIRCISKVTFHGGIGHSSQSWFLPYPQAIGTRLADGSAIIVVVPGLMCEMRKKWPEHNRSKGKIYPLQPDPAFVPLIAWAAPGEPAPRLDLFLAREALGPGKMVDYHGMRFFDLSEEDADYDDAFEWFTTPSATSWSGRGGGRYDAYVGYWSMERSYGPDIEARIETSADQASFLASDEVAAELAPLFLEPYEKVGVRGAVGPWTVYHQGRSTTIPRNIRQGGHLPPGPSSVGSKSRWHDMDFGEIGNVQREGGDGPFVRVPGRAGVLTLYRFGQAPLTMNYPVPEFPKVRVGEQEFQAKTYAPLIVLPGANTAIQFTLGAQSFSFRD